MSADAQQKRFQEETAALRNFIGRTSTPSVAAVASDQTLAALIALAEGATTYGQVSKRAAPSSSTPDELTTASIPEAEDGQQSKRMKFIDLT